MNEENKKLNPKQELFCQEYIIDLNGTQAAIRAGYSERTGRIHASKMLASPNIQKRIAELKSGRCEKTQIDATYVLTRLVEIDQMDVLDILEDDGSVRPVSQWPKSWRQYLTGVDISELFEGKGDEKEQVGLIKKIKWPDKVKNLELLGKHVDVQAFKERIEQSGELDINVTDKDARRKRLAELLSRKK